MNIRDLIGRGRTGLHTERKGYIIEQGFPAERGIFETDHRTSMDPEHGAVTQELTRLHTLDCGHMVNTNTEVLGKCMKCKDNWVCFRCGVRCNRCLKLLCTSCIRLVGDVAYCRGCRMIVWLAAGTITGIRKLHNGLSSK